MKLKITQKATHILPYSQWNNDVPSPCENVAEALTDLEYRIGQIIKNGGSMNLNDVFQSLKELNNAVIAAKDQNWGLDLK